MKRIIIALIALVGMQVHAASSSSQYQYRAGARGGQWRTPVKSSASAKSAANATPAAKKPAAAPVKKTYTPPVDLTNYSI